MQFFASARRWFAHCVIDENETGTPFRLRRVSLLLLAAGWVTFLGSCLLSIWIIRSHLPLVSLAELISGLAMTRGVVLDSLSATDRQIFVSIYWTIQVLQWTGAALFFAGLGSVAVFDKRDGVLAWKAE